MQALPFHSSVLDNIESLISVQEGVYAGDEVEEDGSAMEQNIKVNEDTIFWLDYFTLRQCQADFDLPKIERAIGSIGLTVIELDAKLAYLQRSFCIFETYATLRAKGEIVVCGDGGLFGGEQWQKKRLSAIDSRTAQTRDAEDKRLIDAYITRSVGFDRLNSLVHEAILEGARKFEAHDEFNMEMYEDGGITMIIPQPREWDADDERSWQDFNA